MSEQAARNENSSGGFLSGSWWPSLYSSFSTTIAENLQVLSVICLCSIQYLRDCKVQYCMILCKSWLPDMLLKCC